MYVRNAWYVASWSGELMDAPLARTILDEKVVLYRTAGGVAAALEDCCPHRLAPLSLGTVEGEMLRCGYHGLAFACDGRCVEIPGQASIPPQADARAYPLVERWKLAWIWMGDPALADPDLIPHTPWLDDDAWSYSHGMLRYGCGYVLLNDNLIDLSHTTFTHKQTIGTDDVARTPIETRRENGSVVVERVMKDTEPSKFYRAVGGFSGRVDRWQRIHYTPPSAVVIDAGAVPAGSNDPSRGIDTRVINYLTPETATSVFHFWAFARNFAIGDPETTRFIADQIVHTFNEDLVVLEGQQRNVTERAGRRMLDNAADRGVVLARRLLKERLAAEAPAAERPLPGEALA